MGNEFYPVSLLSLCLFFAVAAVFDLKFKKIPNWLNLIGLAAAVILLILGYGGGLSSLIGLVLGFSLFFLLYIFGVVGGGDVKLMGVAGLFVGFPHILNLLLLACIISSATSLIVLILSGKGGLLIRDFLKILRPILVRLKLSSQDNVAGAEGGDSMVKMPFAPGAFLASLYFSYPYIMQVT